MSNAFLHREKFCVIWKQSDKFILLQFLSSPSGIEHFFKLNAILRWASFILLLIYSFDGYLSIRFQLSVPRDIPTCLLLNESKINWDKFNGRIKAYLFNEQERISRDP